MNTGKIRGVERLGDEKVKEMKLLYKYGWDVATVTEQQIRCEERQCDWEKHEVEFCEKRESDVTSFEGGWDKS